MAASPIKAGLLCRCPNCARGPLYAGLLKFRETCSICGADFSVADVGDGGAFFVMFLALIFIVPAAMLLEFGLSPPIWVHALLWIPITLVFCVALLRPIKAILFALQWTHKAGEARFKDHV